MRNQIVLHIVGFTILALVLIVVAPARVRAAILIVKVRTILFVEAMMKTTPFRLVNLVGSVILLVLLTSIAEAADTWELTDSMNTARYDHGIALLQNGKVLVTAGRNLWYNSVPLTSTEIYDPGSSSWSNTGNLKTGRFLFGNVVTLKTGKVLIAGGTDTSGQSDYGSAELYDPSTGSWSYTGSLNIPRRNPTLTMLDDGRVLISGGRHGPPDGSSFLASAEIYDPSTGVWSFTGHLETAREVHRAVRLQNGKVLVAGGEGPWTVLGNTTELFDPAKGKWTTTGPMSVGWVFATLTLLNDGRVLRAGGWDGGTNYYASAELYDPVTGTWTPTDTMQIARAGHTATLLPDGKVLVSGGNDANGSLASSELYDPSSGTWSLDANFQVDRSGHLAIWLPTTGQVLAVGGWTGHPSTGPLASSELYGSRAQNSYSIDYFALGDSIASGHGLNDDGPECHQSHDRAYPALVVSKLLERYDTVNFHFLACSGASALKPDKANLAKHRYKWLRNQVRDAAKQIRSLPSDRPILISINIGANDFRWAEPAVLVPTFLPYSLYVTWATNLTSQVAKEVWVDVAELLLANKKAKVILTQLYNPFNKKSILFDIEKDGKACSGLFQVRDCYQKTDKGIDLLNDTLATEVVAKFNPKRVRMTSALRDDFRGHGAPKPTCGDKGPEETQSWIQWIHYPNSNSRLPKLLRKVMGEPGDCFHPNDIGAAKYADAVNSLAITMGR